MTLASPSGTNFFPGTYTTSPYTDNTYGGCVYGVAWRLVPRPQSRGSSELRITPNEHDED